MTNRKRTVWAWIVGTLLAMVLYVLSIGPAWVATCYLAQQDPDHTAIVDMYYVAYAPVLWAKNRSQTTYDAFDWYCQLCYEVGESVHLSD